MVKTVTFNLTGSFQEGFSAWVEIWEDGYRIKVKGQLPAAPHISESLRDWQDDFRNKVGSSRARLKKTIQFSSYDRAKILGEEVNKWLNSGHESWQKVRDKLQSFSPDEEIWVIVETDSVELQQIPWQAWDLFAEKYPNSEIALSPPEYEIPYKKPSIRKKSKLRILAVLGDSEGIDIKFDRQELEQNSRWAEIEFLERPTKKKLQEKIVEASGWEIFFFAGHSDTDDNGEARFAINKQERLSIGELKNSLREAIANGLHLAIFNSCKGLGLAKELAQLHLPESIVMREPIPDEVAQEFLQYFLSAFASKNSFYMSVRMARNQLEDSYHTQYPGVSWLPVIYQNPAVETITFPDIWILKHTLEGNPHSVRSIAISPNDKILASAGPNPIIKLWNLETGQPIRELTGHLSEILDIAFSHDGKTFASASNIELIEGTIKLWDTDTWEVKQTLKKSLIGISTRTSSLAFSLDDKYLATGHFLLELPFDIGAIHIWNLATGEVRGTLRGQAWEVWSIAFTPDGRFLLSGGVDGAIKIWDWRNGKFLKNLNRSEDFGTAILSWLNFLGVTYSIAISPDGKTIASSAVDMPIMLWNMETGRRLRTLSEHSESVNGLAFSPDGEILASASDDNTVKIWNPATGECLDTLQHKNGVVCVAFTSDGKTLVSGGKDQTIKVWERLRW